MSERELVRNGWDKIGFIYDTHRDKEKINGELQIFIKLLHKNAHILDAGSGSGFPVANFLINAGYKVTGIDISDTMLNMARKNVPLAEFIKMDMTELTFQDDQFDGIISVFSLFHVARKNHYSIFQKFHKILKPKGILLINTGISESEGVSTFFGVPMFWSNYEPKKTLELVKLAGFSIIFEKVLLRGGEMQYWIFAKNEK